MIIPLEISFRGIRKTEAMDTLIQDQVKKIERLHDHITSCRIAVERRHQHQRSGHPFRIRINIKIPPGHEIVVSKDSSEGDIHDRLQAVLKDAFEAAGRQLKTIVEKQRGETKQHAQQSTGAFVSKLFRDEGYGFLQDLDGREIYFHKNSVLSDGFERLEPGTGVRYVEEPGEKGPQASTVQIVDKPGATIKEEE
ncbi:MAG: HPF/RaiA family ribosome-associated protein [Deltaproteobacteria bacterium]|nr:HPF/RaiA family ribosome-associated protein [Deltaproteobacteria bacterium]